jgi:hypothetical protein
MALLAPYPHSLIVLACPCPISVGNSCIWGASTGVGPGVGGSTAGVSTGGIDEGSGDDEEGVGALVGSAVAVAERVGRAVGEDAAGRVAVAIWSTSSSLELEEQPAASASARVKSAVKSRRCVVIAMPIPLASSACPC